jgi:hypothetical protein
LRKPFFEVGLDTVTYVDTEDEGKMAWTDIQKRKRHHFDELYLGV